MLLWSVSLTHSTVGAARDTSLLYGPACAMCRRWANGGASAHHLPYPQQSLLLTLYFVTASAHTCAGRWAVSLAAFVAAWPKRVT